MTQFESTSSAYGMVPAPSLGDSTRARAETPDGAGQGLSGNIALLHRMLRRGWEFDFFQAVWLLERMHAERVPVGTRGPVSSELIHFRPDTSMAFAATDVRRVVYCRPAGGDEFYQMDVAFLGLYGPSLPLPMHYGVKVLRSVDNVVGPEEEPSASVAAPELGVAAIPDRSALRDLLDIANHRLISLFYRAWTKYRFERTFGLPGQDLLTSKLRCLIGCAEGTEQTDLGVSPIRMIRYAGLLTQRPRAALSLEGLLLDYWKTIDIRVQQFVGRWVSLKSDDLNSIGMANSRLGMDLTVGEEVYDLSGTFKVVIGPVNWATYETLLPTGARFAQTRSLIRLFCTDPVAFKFEVRLDSSEIREARLGGEEGTRLGYTSWSMSQRPSEPYVTVVFDGDAEADVEPAAGSSAAGSSL